jgi:hypothetical protein
VTLCIGGGITGTQKGAEAATRTFAFNFYGSASLDNQGFLPPTVAGQATGQVCTGTYVGGFMGSSYTIGYIDPGNLIPYICVSTTANCGNEHTECNQFIFTMNELFDSLRVVGPEGAGNPVAGCYPDRDMLIDLSNSLDVDWIYFTGSGEGRNVELDWAIAEHDDGMYEVFRGLDAADMQSIGVLEAVEGILEYKWMDQNLEPDDYLYQVVHTSLNGGKSKTEVISVKVMAEHSKMSIAPSIVSDHATLRYFQEGAENRTVKVYNSEGREIMRHTIAGMDGTNQLEMDFSELNQGVYLVELRGGNSVEVSRIVRR